MSHLTTVEDVAARMREIDAELDPDDGVAVFNRIYVTVTDRIAELLAAPGADPPFRDPESMAELDVRFANLWFEAYDASVAGRRVNPAWRPLFQAREVRRVLPVQYAIAGMNSHIEHDLPIAVVETCQARDLEPDDLRRDYEAVNDILAEVEAEIRRSFLDEVGRAADDHLGPVAHLISAWSIDKARDLSWVTVETLWALRRLSFVRGRFLDGLAHTVGMTTRTLLTPVV